MINNYDLYDLHAVLLNIRQRPDYEHNIQIISQIIDVLNNRQDHSEPNQFRKALAQIKFLDKEFYGFVFVENIYTFFPLFLKHEKVYKTLVDAFKYLLRAIEEGNNNKIIDLSDCLHNLPISIVQNKYLIPRKFWVREVKWFRKKWNKDFLM